MSQPEVLERFTECGSPTESQVEFDLVEIVHEVLGMDWNDQAQRTLAYDLLVIAMTKIDDS